MKKVIFLLFMISLHTAKAQPSEILWMQQPSVSPDGQWVAFEYMGNIFKVSSHGGNAVALTLGASYSGYPIWSHDGSTIAFASNRYGNFDVYVMPSSGGTAARLTFDSSKDIPYDFSSDNEAVYFGTDRHDPSVSVRFPADNIWMKLYSVPIKGGRNLLVNAAGTEYVHFDASGSKFLFQDRKGGEDPLRKHHTSAVTRDIWLYDTKTKQYSQLSDFIGEDREPIWGEGAIFYYLSERNGSQNLFRSTTANPKESTQLTAFTKNPVRNLSRSQNGLFVFTQNGELFTMQEGKLPAKISVTITADFNPSQIQRIPVNGNASQIAVSPSGKEVAFTVRGEIYVVSANGSKTKRITNTPFQEAMVYFSSDGRSLIYSVEKNGSWDIYKASIANNSESLFYNATVIETVPILATPKNEFQGVLSPDGKSIAYLEERNTLKVYNLSKHTGITVLAQGNIFSYKDGDQVFSWSPDSRYIILPSAQGHSGPDNILLLDASGNALPAQLTQSGFNTADPHWGMNGKMLYYRSDKNGMTSLSQNESLSDIYAVFLDQEAFDNFRISKSEEEFQRKNNTPTESATVGKNKKGEIALTEKQSFDQNILSRQTIKLTSNSADLSDAVLSPDGENLYYLAKYQAGYDLWVLHPRTHENKLFTPLDAGQASMQLSSDAKNIFVLADGNIIKIDTESGLSSPVSVSSFLELDPQAERLAIFEHVYFSMPKKFFDPKLQGVDWTYYHEQYARFLPHINNNFDFQLLLSEFLGELNSSHTGAKYRPGPISGDETAALGLLYDLTHADNGLKVEEIIAGGPFDRKLSNMRKGYIIDQIDNTAVTNDTDWSYLLNHKKGQHTRISFHNPQTSAQYSEVITPIASREETALLYDRWVGLMERQADSISGGKIGYIHIASMNDANYRELLDKIQGKYYSRKAIIIDTRYNPGGNLQNKLISLFGDKIHLVGKPQGNAMIQDALVDGSFKPTAVLMSEGNYSDGFNFPYLYQKTAIGKLIGTPVAGSGTGVYWEKETDESLIVGFPQIALSWIGEKTILENHQIEPDFKVYNTYNTILSGRDLQLEMAVSELLKEIDSKKPEKSDIK